MNKGPNGPFLFAYILVYTGNRIYKIKGAEAPFVFMARSSSARFASK